MRNNIIIIFTLSVIPGITLFDKNNLCVPTMSYYNNYTCTRDSLKNVCQYCIIDS